MSLGSFAAKVGFALASALALVACAHLWLPVQSPSSEPLLKPGIVPPWLDAKMNWPVVTVQSHHPVATQSKIHLTFAWRH